MLVSILLIIGTAVFASSVGFIAGIFYIGSNISLIVAKLSDEQLATLAEEVQKERGRNGGVK